MADAIKESNVLSAVAMESTLVAGEFGGVCGRRSFVRFELLRARCRVKLSIDNVGRFRKEFHSRTLGNFRGPVRLYRL